MRDISVALSTPSTQVLVSKAIFQCKELKLFGEMSDSTTRARKIQNKPEASCSDRN